MLGKKEYDEKTISLKNPPETLDNFMYIFFSKKYGLKDMIKVEVTSIVDKISNLSNESVEIEAFKKILKNEIDEKFYWYLQELKVKLKEKFEVYYKTKIRKNGSLVDAKNFSDEK